jgi:hypothetical protein
MNSSKVGESHTNLATTQDLLFISAKKSQKDSGLSLYSSNPKVIIFSSDKKAFGLTKSSHSIK